MPRSMTALYDAIGKAFLLVKEEYDGVFVNILTDGLENNSVEFTLSDIMKLIREKRALGWAITFMGTTEDALHEAGAWGISKGNMYLYQDSAVGANMASYKRSTSYSKFKELLIDDNQSESAIEGLMEDDEDKQKGTDGGNERMPF